jgi:hypothetical protein
LALIFLASLLGPPLAAQQLGSADGAQSRFWQALKRSAQPYLLVFEDDSKPVMPAVRKLLQEEGIADLGLVPMPLSAKSSGELRGDALRRFNLAPNTRWAVVDSKEQCLASGQAIPSAEAFAKQLEENGIKSPIRVLRDFLKNNPSHIEARVALLKLQHKTAGQRTRAALGLETDDRPDDPVTQALNRVQWNMRIAGQDIYGRPTPKPIPPGKSLDKEQDITIWGGYADTFDRLLAGSDWIAGGLSFDAGDQAFEICSPMVKALYKRKIKEAEAALARAPENIRLWSVWIRMAEVAGGQSAQAVAGRLSRLPESGFSSWPNAVRNKLIEEARAEKKWDYVAECLWGEYKEEEATPRITFAFASNTPVPDRMKQMRDEMQGRQWDTLFDPLLEALIQMGDIGRADEVMNTLREWHENGHWSETQLRKAIALANRCNRSDIARRWSALLPQLADI